MVDFPWRSKLAIYIIVLLLLSAVLAGCKYQDFLTTSAQEAENRGEQEPQAPQPASKEKRLSQCYVNYQALLEAHPLHEKVIILQQEKGDYQRQQQELTRQVEEMKSRALDNYSGWESDDPARIASLREEYSRRISAVKREGQERLDTLEDRLWKEFTTALETRRQELAAQAQAEIERLEAANAQKLKTFAAQLEEEYYEPLLNLKWKLQYLQLTQEERVSYQNNLQKLLAEKEMRLQNKEQLLKSQLQDKIQEIESQVTRDLEDYYQRKQGETLDKLAEEERALETETEQLVHRLEEEFNQKVAGYRKELQDRTETYLNKTLSNLESELKRKLADLEEKEVQVTAEIRKAKDEIEGQIQDLIEQVTDKNNYILVEKDRNNNDAVDITQLILDKLK